MQFAYIDRWTYIFAISISVRKNIKAAISRHDVFDIFDNIPSLEKPFECIIYNDIKISSNIGKNIASRNHFNEREI